MRAMQPKSRAKIAALVALPLILFVAIYRIRVEQKRTLVHGASVTSLDFSPDGALLMSGNDYDMKLWDVATRTRRTLRDGKHRSQAQSLFSRDGKLLIRSGTKGDNEASVNTWDVRTGKEVSERVMERKNARLEVTALSPDGRFLATADCAGIQCSIRLWNARTGVLLRTLQQDGPYGIYWLHFSPDGKTLVSASQGEDVLLWNVSTGKLRLTLSGLRGYRGRVIAFSPDGKTVAISGLGDVELRDVSTGILRRKLGGSATALCFSPDGRVLARGAAEDNLIGLWDVASGRLLRTLAAHRSSVLSLAFSPDGKTLASGSADNTVKLWDLS